MTRITGKLGVVSTDHLVPAELELGTRINEILDQKPFTTKELASIKKEFECLDPGVRDFMYKELRSGNSPLRQKFLNLNRADRDVFLKALNPKHEVDSEQTAMKKLTEGVKEMARQIEYQEAQERRKIEAELNKHKPLQDPNSLKIDEPVSYTGGTDGSKK